MVEIKNEQIVITLDSSQPEEDITTLRNELLECVSGYKFDCEIGEFNSIFMLLKGLLPTWEQEKKIHK